MNWKVVLLKPSPASLSRLAQAARHSFAGLTYAFANERAFRLEVAVLALATPTAWFVAADFPSFLLLLGSILAILVVELLNTSVEQVCNAVSIDYRDEIKIAKDCASAAVLITSLIAGAIWLNAVWMLFQI